MQRARDWARRRRATHLVLRAVVLLLGAALLVSGAALLVLPGPGWAVIVLGLAVLASEYGWAGRLLSPLLRLAARARGTAVRLRRNGMRATRGTPVMSTTSRAQ